MQRRQRRWRLHAVSKFMALIPCRLFCQILMNFYVPNMVLLGLVCQCIKISTLLCNIVVGLFPSFLFRIL